MTNKEKERVILAAQFDLLTCRWSVASINVEGAVGPLVQSMAGNLACWTIGTFDERTSFLRHRIAGVLQRGSDRLWGRSQKADLFVIEFILDEAGADAKLIQRVADHFCMWMVNPPVICLQTETTCSLSVLATNFETADQARIDAGLTAMRPLTSQTDLWESIPESPQS